MNARFQHMEVVGVIAEPTIKGLERKLVGEVGIVAGWSEPNEVGRRCYGVHFNVLGESLCLPEESLESLGRLATPDEFVTRSRAHQKWRERRGGAAKVS